MGNMLGFTVACPIKATFITTTRATKPGGKPPEKFLLNSIEPLKAPKKPGDLPCVETSCKPTPIMGLKKKKTKNLSKLRDTPRPPHGKGALL